MGEEARTDPFVSWMEIHGSVHLYQRDAVLWEQGAFFDSVYLLRRGRVCLVVKDRREHTSIMRIVEPGELFGLTCLNAQRRKSAPTRAEAALPSEVVSVRCEDCVQFLRDSPDAALSLISNLSERLAYAEDRAHVLVNHNAEDRVCALLEQLIARFGKSSRSKPGYAWTHFTHEQIAELAGLTRSHVTVIMSRLRSKGIVEYDRSTPLLVNLEALGKMRTA